MSPSKWRNSVQTDRNVCSVYDVKVRNKTAPFPHASHFLSHSSQAIIFSLTSVPINRQKLIGLSKIRSPEDDIRL